MVICRARFNTYLLLFAMLLASTGCKSTKDKPEKQIATLRVHLEINPQMTGRAQQIQFLRAAPMMINIENSPFLNEIHVAGASVVEDANGFALAIQFNHQGQRLLEQYSAANASRRFAIRSQFRVSTNVFDRWIAAPLIPQRISNGMLVFTPDADRTETDAIALGLNNVVEKAKGFVDKEEKDEKKPKEKSGDKE